MNQKKKSILKIPLWRKRRVHKLWLDKWGQVWISQCCYGGSMHYLNIFVHYTDMKFLKGRTFSEDQIANIHCNMHLCMNYVVTVFILMNILLHFPLYHNCVKWWSFMHVTQWTSTIILYIEGLECNCAKCLDIGLNECLEHNWLISSWIICAVTNFAVQLN